MSLSVIDVTEEARRRIDAIIGDGSRRNMPVAPPEAPTPAPEPPADEPPADSD
jgi:hypothetical protein